MDKDIKNLGVFSFIFVVLDQLLKIVVSSRIPLGGAFPIIKDFLYVTNVHNTGAAFSILEGSKLLFISIGVIAVGLIIWYFATIEERIEYDVIVCGLLIGGIIGNMIDRLVYGYVIDFLSFEIFEYKFPVFNLADSFIVIAIIFLIARIIKENVWG